MTNYEKYLKGNDEILKQITYGEYKVAVDKSGNLKSCNKIACDDCQFCYTGYTCEECRKRWLDETAEIEVGDIVVITDPGCQYEYYTDWVVKHVEDKKLAVSYRLRDKLYKGDRYRVLAKAQHDEYESRMMLYYIQSEDSMDETCYLISGDGIKPAE